MLFFFVQRKKRAKEMDLDELDPCHEDHMYDCTTCQGVEYPYDVEYVCQASCTNSKSCRRKGAYDIVFEDRYMHVCKQHEESLNSKLATQKNLVHVTSIHKAIWNSVDNKITVDIKNVENQSLRGTKPIVTVPLLLNTEQLYAVLSTFVDIDTLSVTKPLCSTRTIFDEWSSTKQSFDNSIDIYINKTL
jgi:hypothetical protein